MSLFPSIKPAKRDFTPGTLPVSTYNALSGKEVRVILGDTTFETQIGKFHSRWFHPR